MTNQDLLYHYFSSSLTAEQEVIFQKLLETDAEFKAQFDHENSLKKAIKGHEADIMKAKLQGFEEEISAAKLQNKEFFESETTKVKTVDFSYRKLAFAATFALLFGWLGYNALGTNYSSIYTENFNTYPNTVYAITRSSSDNTLERGAFAAYELEDYKTAIEKFDSISDPEAQKYIPFYKAQAYLKLEDAEIAKKLFTQVVQENTNFVAESTWYLALIAIKEENKNEAINHLQILIENYSYNKDVAKALLKELK